MATLQLRPPHGSLVTLGRSSDERLSRRATRGDKQALGAIFDRYQQELYRFCLGLLGEPQDAQDALQNTMVKALRALPGEKRDIALRPWLYRIAHNEAIDLRRTRRETQTLDRHLLDAHSSVAETAEHRERLQWLLRDFGDLPERQRAVLVMRELSGLDFADIGAALGTSSGVVRQTLYEARRNLEQMDFGRNLRCEAIAQVLSDADGRIAGRREIRAHLRDCSECRNFQERIQARKEALAGIVPLPLGAAGFLHAVLGSAGGSGAGGVAAALGGGAAGSAGTVGVLKAVATVAAVVVVGTAAVERSSHDHPAAGHPAAAPSAQPSRAVRRAPEAARPNTPHEARFLGHGSAEAPPAGVAHTPSRLVARTQPGVRAARSRSSGNQAGAPVGEGSAFSASPVPVADRPTAAQRAAPEPPKGSEAEQPKSAKKAETQGEKAVEAEAKGKPERPSHPEHPPHPAQSQKPAEPSPRPEDDPREVEATSAPAPDVTPEPTSHSPNGKAKGHEAQLPG